MPSPAKAIAWEIWRKNQWPLTLVMGAIPASFLVWATFGSWVPEITRVFEFFMILLSTVVVFWAFSFAESDTHGRHSGFPSRMYILPVRTVKLVSYPVLYGTVGIWSLYFVWMSAISIQWKVEIPWGMMLCHAGLLATLMVSIQAIVWALHRFNWTRVLLLSGTATFVGCIGLFAAENDIWPGREGLLTLCGSVFLLAYVGAFKAVELDRRGQLFGWLEEFYRSIIDAVPWRRRPFGSPQQAQFWLEWQRRGWLLACLMGSVMAFALALFPLATALYLDSTSVLLNYALLPVTTLWCAASAGMYLAKSDLWSPELRLHPITAMGPISTGEVVIAKLKVAAAITALGWILFSLLVLPALRLSHLFGHLNEEVFHFWDSFPAKHHLLVRWARNPVVILTALGVIWHVVVQGMCPALFGKVRKNIWAVGFSLSLFGIAVGLVARLVRYPENVAAFLRVLPWVTAACLIWKWNVAARAFARAYENANGASSPHSIGDGREFGALYRRQQWRVLLALWLALTVGVAGSAWLACAAHGLPAPIILFLAVWLLPSGELLLCAENLARNRHRSQ